MQHQKAGAGKREHVSGAGTLGGMLRASDYLAASEEGQALAKALRRYGIEYWLALPAADEDPCVRFRVNGVRHEVPFTLGGRDTQTVVALLEEVLGVTKKPAATAPDEAGDQTLDLPLPPKFDPKKLDVVRSFCGQGVTTSLARTGVNMAYHKSKDAWLMQMRAMGLTAAECARMLRESGNTVSEQSLSSYMSKVAQRHGHRPLKKRKRASDKWAVASTVAKAQHSPALREVAAPVTPAPVQGEVLLGQDVVAKVDKALQKLIDERLAVLLGRV